MELGPAVVPHRRIIRPEGPDELDLFPVHLLVGRRLRLPKDLLSDREVAVLLRCEVAFNEPAVDTAEVIDGPGQILPDVDLPIG
jgi:hypothetical protein